MDNIIQLPPVNHVAPVSADPAPEVTVIIRATEVWGDPWMVIIVSLSGQVIFERYIAGRIVFLRLRYDGTLEVKAAAQAA